MKMSEKSIASFLELLASKAPVPGGGGAAAMAGAIGMALANMVGNLTAGKKKFAAVEEEVRELLSCGCQVMEVLQALADRDAEVFEPLAKAYSLPTDTPEQVAHKAKVMEERSIAACLVPLEIMRQAYSGIKIHQRMGQIGTRLAISDVGCGVVLLKAALISARLNVLINLAAIGDQQFLRETTVEMEQLLADGCALADETLAQVSSELSSH